MPAQEQEQAAYVAPTAGAIMLGLIALVATSTLPLLEAVRLRCTQHYHVTYFSVKAPLSIWFFLFARTFWKMPRFCNPFRNSGGRDVDIPSMMDCPKSHCQSVGG
eukprot:893961-Amphidinium_carterae.1